MPADPEGASAGTHRSGRVEGGLLCRSKELAEVLLHPNGFGDEQGASQERGRVLLLRFGYADEDLLEFTRSVGVRDHNKACWIVVPHLPTLRTHWAMPVPLLFSAAGVAGLRVSCTVRATKPSVWSGWVGFTCLAGVHGVEVVCVCLSFSCGDF